MVSGWCYLPLSLEYIHILTLLRLTKFLKIHEAMGLQQTCQQCHTVETICKAMIDLHLTYSNARAHEMVSLLFHEQSMSMAR
jgi:hypothetical protein